MVMQAFQNKPGVIDRAGFVEDLEHQLLLLQSHLSWAFPVGKQVSQLQVLGLLLQCVYKNNGVFSLVEVLAKAFCFCILLSILLTLAPLLLGKQLFWGCTYVTGQVFVIVPNLKIAPKKHQELLQSDHCLRRYAGPAVKQQNSRNHEQLTRFWQD